MDVLLSGKGAKLQDQRIERFLADVNERLQKLESGAVLEPDGELWDLMIRTFDAVSKERSEDKRRRFASIIVKQVKENCDINQAIDAVILLSDQKTFMLKY